VTLDLVFGKYEIQHRLAIGGMGEVFYAVQKGVPGFERAAILKSLLPDLASQEGFIDQFLDEARVAATLNHPNVVSIYEVGQWNGTYFIAMEYIRGRNLSQLIRRALENQQRVPPMVVARIIRDAAGGLDHAHRATDTSGRPLNIVHRDISPQNIMVRDDGVTKVVDFGIASASNRATRTATGALKGKLAYMAPEQIVSRDLTGAVDQYALGVVFWEMLTSRRLFKADSDMLIAKKVLEEQIPAPSTLAPDISPVLDDIVMRMIQRDIHQRFPSCSAVAAALEQVVTANTPPSGESPVTSFMRRLGTEDLVVKVRPSAPSAAGNFVISLKSAAQEGTPSEVDVMVPTAAILPPVAPADEAPPGSRRRMVAVALVAALGLIGFGVSRAISPPSVMVEVDSGAPVVAIEPPKPEVVDAGPAVVEVPKAPGKLRVSSAPAGAALRLDGRPMGATPQEFEVSPGVPHYLMFEKAGFKDVEQELTVEPGESRNVMVKLEQRKSTASPTPPVTNTQIVERPAGKGILLIDTQPWTRVRLDGEPKGQTPLRIADVAVGRHVLELSNDDANVSWRQEVTVRDGETTKVKLAK
jgi:eukaryotic-like serine/threonine-protein kinase